MSTPMNGENLEIPAHESSLEVVLQDHEICLAPLVAKGDVILGTMMELGSFLQHECS